MSNENMGELKQRVEELEVQLKIEQKRCEMFTDTSDYGLWEYDIQNKRLIQSHKLEGQWSDPNCIVDNYREQMKKWDMIYSEDLRLFDDYVDSMDRGDTHVFSEIRILRDDARLAWIRFEGNTVCNSEGKPIRVIGRTVDITKEKQDNDQLEKRISRDTLTGLYRKATATNMIDKKLSDSQESSGALLIIDIDEFHKLKESYGKLYSEGLLESTAGLIYTNFKAKDIVGRIGGDEFVVYCSNVPDENSVSKLLSKLMLRFQEFIVTPDKTAVTISIGASVFPQDGNNFEELFRHADIALYQAKHNGKNQYCFYRKKLSKITVIGESYRKMQAQKKLELISNKQYTDVNKELFNFAFDVINHESDFYHAMQIIFEEICLYFMLDRSTLLEFNTTRGEVRVSARWTCEDDGRDKEIIEEGCNSHWSLIEQKYIKQDYTIVQNGDFLGKDYIKELDRMTKPPVTALVFSIKDGNKIAGLVIFEVWKKRELSNIEITTLLSIIKIISSYLIQIQTKAELETEYLIGKKVMDVQELVYYIVDESTQEINYLSTYAKETLPHAKVGQKCYKAIWDKKKPCEECPIYGCVGDKTQNIIEVYDGKNDVWNTTTATLMEKTEDTRKFLVCKANVTAFLERVKGEDQLTGATTYEKFRLDALKMIRNKKCTYVLAFLGIREFSKINDEYGYEIGDQILKMYSHLLQESLEEGELLCRIKGDDFAVLSKKHTLEWMRMKLKTISDYITGIFREQFPSISIHSFGGVYVIPENEEYISRCLDKAMKARKIALKNFYETAGVYVYSKEFERQEKEKEIMNKKMKESLQKENFKVYFQPKVDILTEKIVGAEALVRLVDQDGEMIYPGKFIPLAEESGFIVKIDRFVYEKTFRLMREWIEKGKEVPLISVNLSRLHLLNENFPQEIRKLSDQYGLSPNQIELEITESIFFEDTERLVGMIKQMKDMGYVISMDDFGAGFSTLSLMKTMPIDVVKIDGGFFLQNEMDTKNRAVIAAIMQLSYNLDLGTVSEGVETKEQVDFIKQQGGRCVQGYYFYRPMPAEEFEKLLESSSIS